MTNGAYLENGFFFSANFYFEKRALPKKIPYNFFPVTFYSLKAAILIFPYLTFQFDSINLSECLRDKYFLQFKTNTIYNLRQILLRI